jgi:hypothetical protein
LPARPRRAAGSCPRIEGFSLAFGEALRRREALFEGDFVMKPAADNRPTEYNHQRP